MFIILDIASYVITVNDITTVSYLNIAMHNAIIFLHEQLTSPYAIDISPLTDKFVSV